MNVWPDGYGCIELQSIDSTLDEAGRIAPDLSGPTWIFAHEQTAARGRRGRPWVFPKGNFAGTLVLPNAGVPAAAALRSFIASIALYDALVSVTGQPALFALKWPNDVLLNGGKLAGILLEGLPNGGLAIGVGVNLASAPNAAQVEARALPPVSLYDAVGTKIAPLDFLTIFATAYALREAQFADFGFAPIRHAWMAHAARIKERITVRLPNQELHGIFQDIDVDGQLILLTDQGPRKIAAGDVFF